MFWEDFPSANRITTFHHMHFKRILIGLAVVEFDRMRTIWLVFLPCKKDVLSKNRSNERQCALVLNPTCGSENTCCMLLIGP